MNDGSVDRDKSVCVAEIMPSIFSAHVDLILIPRCVMLMIDLSREMVTMVTVIQVTHDVFIPLHWSFQQGIDF